MLAKKEKRKIPSAISRDWVLKEGYETRLLADELDMEAPETEVQIVRFHKGKYSHHHKRKTEFFYFTSGQGYVIVDGEKRDIKAGFELLVKPGVHHEFVNESNESLEAIMLKTNSQPNDTFAK